jgi:hypothetical protein
MPFNLLILPLLGGYVFITYWNFTRFGARRYSGERLLLHAALAGVFWLVISYLAVHLIESRWPTAPARWREIVPFAHSGTSLGALLLGVTAWIPLNLVFSRKTEHRRTIRKWNDYLEELIDQALEETRQVSVTLKNGKVYVGFMVRAFDPAYDRKYVVILPTISGFRAETTHKVTLNTDYTRVYQELMGADETRLVRGVEDFQVVIPIAEVLSTNLFDPDAYSRFNPESEPT